MRIYASDVNDRPRFFFSATPFDEHRVYFTIEQCIDVMRTYAIASSALSFPTVRPAQISLGEHSAYIAFSNIGQARQDELEEWRLYRNGAFRYRANFWELGDYNTQERIRQKTIHVDDGREPLGYINIVALCYRITAAHVFAARLFQVFATKTELITSGIDGTLGYAIGRIDQAERFATPPIAKSNDATFRFVPLPGEQALDPFAVAAECIDALLAHFAWKAPPAQRNEWLEDVREILLRI